MKFVIEQSNENLTPHSGLALVGALLDKTNLKKRLNQTKIVGVANPSISHWEVITSYVGLLCQGKNDFDHIEPFREDNFFALALGLNTTPSSPTLRQRIDAGATNDLWSQVIPEESVELIKSSNAPLTPIVLDGNRKYLPVDTDVSPFDNSKTKKEAVSRTYKGYDGYAPIFAYLGQEGYCIGAELRPGKDHCQKGTVDFLRKVINNARRITNQPLLMRLDSGNDSADNLSLFEAEQTKVDYIIKRNLRRESSEMWLNIAEEQGTKYIEREGKTVYTGSTMKKPKGFDTPVRIAYKVVERTVLANGQILLVPDVTVDTYWVSLPDPADTVIGLYHEHGTSEQFHSEFKTDLDLERLPSGKFATNALILLLGMLSYNILRIIGQLTVELDQSVVPLRKKAHRRRLRTVIQNLITIASRLVYHARQYKLRFGRFSPWLNTFKQLYAVLRA